MRAGCGSRDWESGLGAEQVVGGREWWAKKDGGIGWGQIRRMVRLVGSSPDR